MNKKDEIIEMSPYAPIRKQNEQWWVIGDIIAENGGITRDGKCSDMTKQLIKGLVIDPHIDYSYEVSKEARQIAIAYASNLGYWVQIAAQYKLSGKQIFDLGETLVEMLSNTDVGDCTLKDWQAPYDAFFIRFGKQNKINLTYGENKKAYVDGAFISISANNKNPENRNINIGFSYVKEDGRDLVIPEEIIRFLPEDQCIPINDAIKNFINRRIKNINEESIYSELDNLTKDDQLKSADEKKVQEAIKSCLDKEIENIYEENIDSESDNIIKDIKINSAKLSETILTTLVELVINSMFYIESIKGEIKSSPGRDAPPNMVAAWENAKPEKRVKLRRNLSREGYTIVKFTGHELNNNSHHTGDSKKTHWRRGHWRNQAHGQNKSLIKRIWIKPVMVNSSKLDGEDVPGHIYVAEDKPAVN